MGIRQKNNKMKLIFWQNCVSPHQLSYIKELYKDDRISKVFLIAPVWDLAEREKMGWSNSFDTNGIETIISPDDNEIESLLRENQENSIHLFSGIRADQFVFACFKKSLVYHIKRGIITESPYLFKKPLFLHKLRFLLFDYKYVSKIDYVFAMGYNAVNYYKKWSNRWRVFPFAYCVDTPHKQVLQKRNNCLRLIYVGSLIKRKNVSIVLKGIKKLFGNTDFTLDIIGNGPEEKELKQYCDFNNISSRVTFHGNMAMKEIHDKLIEFDVLILPSLHDGWGAVVNEGLQSGLYIISSDKCGAKTLIEDSNRGVVFKSNNLSSLVDALNFTIKNADKITAQKHERVLWAGKISGTSLAKYMLDCLATKDSNLPPWKKDN